MTRKLSNEDIIIRTVIDTAHRHWSFSVFGLEQFKVFSLLATTLVDWNHAMQSNLIQSLPLLYTLVAIFDPVWLMNPTPCRVTLVPFWPLLFIHQVLALRPGETWECQIPGEVTESLKSFGVFCHIKWKEVIDGFSFAKQLKSTGYVVSKRLLFSHSVKEMWLIYRNWWVLRLDIWRRSLICLARICVKARCTRY